MFALPFTAHKKTSFCYGWPVPGFLELLNKKVPIDTLYSIEYLHALWLCFQAQVTLFLYLQNIEGEEKKSRQAPKIANRKKSTILLQSLWNLV